MGAALLTIGRSRERAAPPEINVKVDRPTRQIDSDSCHSTVNNRALRRESPKGRGGVA
jgi:hypothetical protein